jgi:hypothetical protein
MRLVGKSKAEAEMSRLETVLMVASSVLWLAIVGLGATGRWFPALFVLLGLMLVYGMLGTARGGRFELKLVAFPILAWLLFWAVSFVLANHYLQAGPGQSMLGFHPSFAWIIIFYWIGGTLVMGLGFEAIKDRWLSQERWDEFVKQVAAETPDKEEGQ